MGYLFGLSLSPVCKCVRSCTGQWSKLTGTVLNEWMNAARLLYLFGGVPKDAYMTYMH